MKPIVKSSILSDEDLAKFGLNQRLYFRVGAPGTGMRVSDLPLRALDSVSVANHPDYAASTGEKRNTLYWCDKCQQYGEVDCFKRCESCKPVDNYNPYD